MDVILKSEIILVALEREEGVTFEEFSGLFHQVHGYQLKLKNYGYNSLKDLLDDMKDEVELKNVNGQQLIKYRPPCIASSCQKGDLYISDTSSMSSSSSSCWSQSGDIALDEFPNEQPSSQQNAAGISGHMSSPSALQSTSQVRDYLTSGAYFTMDTCFTIKQIPSNEIVQIISQKLRDHPTGLRADKLRQYILEKHNIDLEIYSQILGYEDMLSMLKEIPAIKFLNTSGKNIIIASCFYRNLVKDQPKVSAKATPSSASNSTASHQHSAQSDVSSNQKKANNRPLLNVGSPSQGNAPSISGTCTESLHDRDSKAEDLLKMKVNHTQSSSPHEDSTPPLLVDGHSPKQKCVNTMQKPLEETEKIISETVIRHHFGLKAKTLKEYMMSQHKIDLEVYSKQQGYTDMLSMLKQIPGIAFADDSKTNLLIALGSHDKPHNSQPGQRKTDPLSWKKVADVLRGFPSGLRVEKLKQQVLNIYRIDIEALSHELGYTDMLSMLQEVPGIKSLNGEVFFASDSHMPKAPPVKKSKFSEKGMVDFLKSFSSGLKVERLNQRMKNKYNIDLIRYSQEKGFTNVVCWLKNIPGITVLNKNLVFASDVYKSCNSKSKTTPVKCPMNAGTALTKKSHVGMKTPQGSQAVPKPIPPRPTGTSQQTPRPICQIPLTNARINVPQQGLRTNVSYASACAGNLRMSQINVHSQQSPPIFNVQKAQTAKTTHPTSKEAPKAALPSSKIKDNLQLLLKSHSNGLSIFRLKKLYLLKFQHPLVPKGSSARKLLMGMKDVAEIKGVGVQMKVIPVLSEDPPASANTYRDSTPQEAAPLQANDARNNEALTHLQVSSRLSILKRTEHINHSINHTESAGEYIPLSSSKNINHKQPLDHNQQMTEICGKQLVTTTISNQANNYGVLGSQFSKTYEPHTTAGIAGDLSDDQWPSLPQKCHILKQITHGNKMPEQLYENVPNKRLVKQNPIVTPKPEVKVNVAQTSLQAHQNLFKTNGKTDHKQEDRTSEQLHESIPKNELFSRQNPTAISKLQEKDTIAHTSLQVHQDPFKTIGKTDHKQEDLTLELHENISNDNLFFKQNPTATSKPQEKINIAQTLLQGHQNPYKTNGKPDQKQKNQTSDLCHPTLQSGFSFVMEETGFSFVKGEMTTNKDKKSTEIGRKVHATPLQLNQSTYCNVAAPTEGSDPGDSRRSADVLTQQKMSDFNSENVTQQTNNDPVTSGTISSICSMPNQKSTASQSQQQTTSVCNQNVDSLEPKMQEALLQPQGMQPSCTRSQMASMTSKEELEASSSKSISEFGYSGSILSPPKQEGTVSKSTKEVPNSETVTKSGTQHMDQSESSPVSHSQQNLPANPSANTKGSPISHKDNFNTANGQTGLKTLKQEHSQTKDGADATKAPLSSAQQNDSSSNVYTHEQRVTEPFQTHANVPHPHASSRVEQSQSVAGTPNYFNGTTERPLDLGGGFTLKSYQHLHHSHQSGITSQPEILNVSSDQEDSSEESTKTWQTDSGQSCCIL